MSPRHVSALGALVTVASLAIDPFVQQVASYRLNILTPPEPTSLPVRLGFKDNYGAYQAATYAALYNFGTVTQTSQNCFGNCTWGPYTTLAVCSQCANISHLVSSSKPISTYRPSNKPTDSKCLWTLPNGLNLSFGHSVGDTISSGEFPAITFHNNDSAILNFTLLSNHNPPTPPQPQPIPPSTSPKPPTTRLRTPRPPLTTKTSTTSNGHVDSTPLKTRTYNGSISLTR